MRTGGVIVVLVILGAIVWVILSNSAGASPLASATLASTNGSSVSGSAGFVPTSSGESTSVTVTLQGLQQGSVYGVTVNEGSCLGPLLYVLNGVPGNGYGQGSSTTSVPSQPRGDWFIAVHYSASAQSPLVACGQVIVTGSVGSYSTPSGQGYPGGYPAQQPYQMPNGGGGPPRTPIPTPVAAR